MKSKKQVNADYRQRRKEQTAQVLGTECFFCGYEERCIIHRKDGTPHKKFKSMGKAEYAEHIQSDDYVIVCFHCHKGVHWAMKWLNLTWDEIVNMGL